MLVLNRKNLRHGEWVLLVSSLRPHQDYHIKEIYIHIEGMGVAMLNGPRENMC